MTKETGAEMTGGRLVNGLEEAYNEGANEKRPECHRCVNTSTRAWPLVRSDLP